MKKAIAVAAILLSCSGCVSMLAENQLNRRDDEVESPLLESQGPDGATLLAAPRETEPGANAPARRVLFWTGLPLWIAADAATMPLQLPLWTYALIVNLTGGRII